MSVAHPSTINIGTGRMILDVSDEDNGQPIEEALVCLWKGSETYERAVTDLNGHVEMPLNIATEGELLVTVTKRNHKPYLASVMCVPSAQTVGLTYYTVDDNAGNNDGIFNPGEMIDLPVYLQNFGTADVATGVSATLVSQNPRVTVINGSQTFANINPGDSALSAAPFRVLLSAQMQNEESALLVFTITTAAGQTFSDIEIECVAPDAQYETHNFTGAVNPGTTNNLRVTLHNGGALPLLGTMATLVSLSPFVQVDDGGGVYGDIQPNQNITNTADQFTLTSNTLTFRGHQAPMRLIVATSNGFVDTTQFIVSIGSAIATDPTGPDAYGYFAYDNSDVSYEMHPEFSYVDISAGLGTDLDINDIGEKTMISQLWSEVRDLPFAFTYYGETYNEITVCSNGWIAFGDQGFNDHFRNYPIPAIFAPENMVAPYWDDLKTDGSRGVWDYYDEANHRYIVQWKAQATWTATNLDFEVILYDEFFDPTFDGNGQILFQYNDATMGIDGHYEEPNGCTIGIQNARNTIGLQYAFLTTYMPGSATITDGRAILFSTNARMLFGAIEGTVTDAETSLPLPGVDVTIDGFSYHTLTDATGHFLLDDVLIGTYTVRVHKRAYNDATTANIVVELDSTETVNYAMLHPEYEMSRDTLYFTIPGDPVVTTFDIVNDGNGPLDYGMTITYGGDDSPEPWDWLDGINLTDSTGDFMMQGCEFVGDYWWVSGGSGEGGNNFFYKFDIHGVYAGAIPQPSTTAFGWFDLAYDGEYLYGSDSHVITGVDESGIPQTTINSPLNPSRAIAYDPASDHFWVADYGSDIYEISRDGTVIQQIANEGENELNITGLAWNELDDEGYHLYLFSQNGTGIQTRLSKMHPVSHDIQLITTLEGQPGDHAGGLAITPAWNSTLLVIAGVLQNSLGDRLGIYEVTFNTTWIDVTPMANTVPGGNTQEVTVTIDPDMLRANEYRVNLNIASVVLDTTYRLPVILYVLDTAPDDRDGSVPQEFALYQNYPNPFNPSTEIRFDLPQTIDVELRVYNTLGQLVSTLVNETQTAGSHVVRWNGTSDFGEAVATGLYIYEVRAGSFVQAKKMIFLR